MAKKKIDVLERIKNLAKISLTKIQIAWMLDLTYSEVCKYNHIIKENLPSNFLKIRLKRYGKAFGINERIKIERKIFGVSVRKRIESSFRSNMRHHIKNKTRHTFISVGYNVIQLMQHLEKLFQPGMTWDNYGEWHIDHKIPASWFKYNNVDDKQFKQCWSLKNLQPLWRFENLSKNNKYAG